MTTLTTTSTITAVAEPGREVLAASITVIEVLGTAMAMGMDMGVVTMVTAAVVAGPRGLRIIVIAVGHMAVDGRVPARRHGHVGAGPPQVTITAIATTARRMRGEVVEVLALGVRTGGGVAGVMTNTLSDK